LEKIKEQQRETREGLAALRQRFEDQGAAAAESQAEVKGLLQQLLAGSGTSAGSVAGGGTAREAQGEDGVRGRIESAPAAGDQEALAREEEGEDRAAAAVRSRSVRPRAREEAARLEAKEAELVSLEADLKAKAEEVLRLKLRQRGEEPGAASWSVLRLLCGGIVEDRLRHRGARRCKGSLSGMLFECVCDS